MKRKEGWYEEEEDYSYMCEDKRKEENEWVAMSHNVKISF